jgi:hypothetical protein
MKKIGCGMKATACEERMRSRFKKIVYIIYASRTSRKRPEEDKMLAAKRTVQATKKMAKFNKAEDSRAE